MLRPLLIVTVSLTLSGCMVFPSVGRVQKVSDAPTQPSQIAPTEVAVLKPGSSVQILSETTNSRIAYQGTVLHASPDGVALINCLKSGRYEHPGIPIVQGIPYVNRLFKNSGVGQHPVPVQWVSIREMTSVEEIAPPPPGYVAPQLDINTNDQPVYERIGVDFNFNVVP